MMYSQCRDGAVIELYTIDGLGRKVPTKEMPAAQIIWEFFEAHPMP
jgi:poly(3-hydroxybutyrate) depolymerase